MSRKDYSLDPNVIASLRGVAQKRNLAPSVEGGG